MQDPNPLPWGALDRFQAHFIVRKQTLGASTSNYVAKTILKTEGHFDSKTIVDVRWNGGQLADVLNQDSSLNEMISKQSVHNATIFVDPTDEAIRIHGKWDNKNDFTITKEMFEIFDKIASHIKSL